MSIVVSPMVTTQPVDRSVTAGTTTTFTAAATGTPAPDVQWESSSDGVTFAPIAGATSPTLTVISPTVGQTGTRYRAVFTNAGGPGAAPRPTRPPAPPLPWPPHPVVTPTATPAPSASAGTTVPSTPATTPSAAAEASLAATGAGHTAGLTILGLGSILAGALLLLVVRRWRVQRDPRSPR